jgi:hypothetical protein
MRAKYVEEKYPKWFDHGGLVIGFQTEREKNRPSSFDLVDEHNLVVDKLAEMALAWDETDTESFTKFWYGDKI